ncbi:MAG: hypothetical protein V1690_03820, partial [Candidatus Moraniibacteriota bacterium]
MKKIITFGLGIVVLSFCLGAQNLFKAQAYIAAADSSATIVVGQQDMSSNLANQNGSVAATTSSSPCHVFGYGDKFYVADTYN